MDGNERKAAQVLDECLRGIESGQVTVEDCLRLHPEFGDSLGPLLTLAVQTQQGLAPAAPSAVVRDQTEARLLNRLHKVTASGLRTPPPSIRRAWSRRPAIALASLSLILSLLVLTTGVAYASTEALPGDLLYPVKQGLEQARLAISTTPEGDTALLVGFADERLAEAEALAAAGRLADLESALQGYESEITALVSRTEEISTEASTGFLEYLESRLSHHLEVLARVRTRVPASAQQAIGNAIERAGQGRSAIEQARGRGNPSDQAPGQQGRPDEGATDGQGNGLGSGGGSDEGRHGSHPGQGTPRRPLEGTPGPRGEG